VSINESAELSKLRVEVRVRAVHEILKAASVFFAEPGGPSPSS
jgi:hypothetical protein